MTKIITDTSIPPFNKICHLTIFRERTLRKNSWFNSTGFFISRNCILTAAHNVHSQFGTQVAAIVVNIGQYQETSLFPPIEIRGKDQCQGMIRTPSAYGLTKKYYKRIRKDYGIIYLPDQLLPSGFTWNNEFDFSGPVEIKEDQVFQVAGYPAEEMYDSADRMVFQEGAIRAKNKYAYAHSFTTYKGNSGSPVWLKTESGNRITGIHTFSRSGTIINASNHSEIINWISEFN